jgi:hypothetical protein
VKSEVEKRKKENKEKKKRKKGLSGVQLQWSIHRALSGIGIEGKGKRMTTGCYHPLERCPFPLYYPCICICIAICGFWYGAFLYWIYL